MLLLLLKSSRLLPRKLKKLWSRKHRKPRLLRNPRLMMEKNSRVPSIALINAVVEVAEVTDLAQEVMESTAVASKAEAGTDLVVKVVIGLVAKAAEEVAVAEAEAAKMEIAQGLLL